MTTGLNRDVLVKLFRAAPKNACFSPVEVATLLGLRSATHTAELFAGMSVSTYFVSNYSEIKSRSKKQYKNVIIRQPGKRPKKRYSKEMIQQMLRTRTVDFKNIPLSVLRSELL